MQNVLVAGIAIRRLLAAALVTTLAMSSTALFQADGPGALLEPIGDAGTLVNLVQGHHSILWTSQAVTVDSYQVIGWPTSDDSIELGGALMIEKVDADAGVIEFGERPMSLQFDLAG